MQSLTLYAALLLLGFLFVDLPLFQGADKPPSDKPDRALALDGLRGLLALSVVIHHGAVNYDFIRNETWKVPDSRLLTFCGQGAVALFFMITGYLFWGKIIANGDNVNFFKLYIGRVCRIIPVYYTVIICAILVIISYNYPPLPRLIGNTNIFSIKFSKELVRWFSGGLLSICQLNGDPASDREFSMVWTLRYEWIFYMSLLPLSWLMRLRAIKLFLIPLSLIIILLLPHGKPAGPTDFSLANLFIFGMAIAYIKDRKIEIFFWASATTKSIITFSLLALVASIHGGAYSAFGEICLGLVFLLIIEGSDLFGMLSLRCSRRMGDISYDLYLAHGLIYYLAFKTNAILHLALSSTATYWLIVAGCEIVAISVAVALHVAVERPGIAIGRNLIERLAGTEKKVS